ncbi:MULTISPECIES: protease inhibitor Inh/omp19 family protein [Alphaproteobacteria]|uniref:Outer membrane lipoprotein omp19 n=2 Tax=Alphaproteobacteria TaxID=28211 RepID=A0A512HK04_9HYPH|nr:MULTISPECIES: protease inhibitor Inh/omp19 family protein [Alphaproteobacteria]GEO85740.1 outer membrane lipoprotein omp19 [Ciceribacter naphthalenivorans]GLR21900.1 outer membrane lipoprotein omp19 [Ciceribacter naphthalenivorans]GLT04756.1 outer membrane lipoprotein omp19 [Sphingomonas psychrolutea]
MKLKHVATGVAILLSLAGCQRASYSGFNSGASSLPPLEAQPVPSVQSGQLPPPGASSNFPAAPAPMTQTAAADVAPATALDLTKESMVGNWRVSNAGTSCDMFLTLTNLGSGSRGGTRGCAGPLTAMGSWEVSGKQVVLKDRSGNVLGRLYKTADARYDGTTNTGQPISLSR